MGVPDSPLKNREEKLNRIIHAEMNALLFLRERATGYLMYTWPMPPCVRCAAHIIQSGMLAVVCPRPTADMERRWNFDDTRMLVSLTPALLMIEV